MKNIKIAVTGGPSGGKTTLLDTIKRELGQKVQIVPEAASILYRGGFPRLKTTSGLRHSQRAIYATQKEVEDLIFEQADPSQLIICDRGSLDGIAYWPEIQEGFLESIGSRREYELARYDWVIHLDTANAQFYDTSNPVRTESHAEALRINEKIKKAWEGHTHRVIIGSNTDFIAKIQKSIHVIQAIAKRQPLSEIQKLIAAKEPGSSH